MADPALEHIDVLDVLGQRMDACLLDRRCHSRTDDRLGLAQRPERDVEPEHVAEPPHHLAPARVTIEATASTPGRTHLAHPHGQGGAGGLAAYHSATAPAVSLDPRASHSRVPTGAVMKGGVRSEVAGGGRRPVT